MRFSFDLGSQAIPPEMKSYLGLCNPLATSLRALATWALELPDLHAQLKADVLAGPMRQEDARFPKRIAIKNESVLCVQILETSRQLHLPPNLVFVRLCILAWKRQRLDELAPIAGAAPVARHRPVGIQSADVVEQVAPAPNILLPEPLPPASDSEIGEIVLPDLAAFKDQFGF